MNRPGERFDVERALGSLGLKPAPGGLRDRTLAAAGRVRASAALTPGKALLGLVALAVIAAASLGDTAVSRAQAGRLRAMLEPNKAAAEVRPADPADIEPLLAEVASGTTGIDGAGMGLGVLTRLLESRRAAAAVPAAAELREILKGWD